MNEKLIAELRHNTAMDAMSKRHRHTDLMAAAALEAANAKIKQLERQLADYHHMSELVNGKMAENARLRRINEKLTARAEADAALKGDALNE